MNAGKIIIGAVTILATALATMPAEADSWKGHGRKHESRYDDGECVYKRKETPGMVKEEYKCRNGERARRPLPWVAARPHPQPQGSGLPYGFDLGNCNRETLASLIGGATGAALGSRIGEGSGKIAAVAGGTILGFLIGGGVGRSMDRVDQACVGQILEHAPNARPIAWNNPATAVRYEVVPLQTYQDRAGRYCREYQTTATIGGRPQQVYGTACRQPDGSWEHMN